MAVSLFLSKTKKPQRSKLEEIVLRGFGGGWNEIDEDTNMEAKYQPELKNFRRTPAGAQKLRHGTKMFSYVNTVVTGNIVDMTYFNNRLIVVTSTGQIASVDSSGAPYVLWNATIAAGLPFVPPPTAWGATTQVSFVPWKDSLIIHNGQQKPVIINSTYAPTYLSDLATGSTVNVPIGYYGCIAANYHCVAGVTGYPTTVWISSRGTAGTFSGDPAPNDGISIDVGAYAPSGAPSILGLAGYRQFLVVFFRGQSLIVQLGEYDQATPPNHTPQFIDEMPQFGIINHRCVTTVENDLRFAGYDGLASGKRNLFSGNIDTKFLSVLIEPAWREDLPAVPVGQPFIVHNPIEHCTYLMTNDTVGTTYVYQADQALKYESWTRFEGEGLRVVCGCRSFLGRVFLAGHVGNRTAIYLMGNDIFTNESYTTDLDSDFTAFWANSTAYTAGQRIYDTILSRSYECVTNHTSAAAGTFAADRANPAGAMGKWEHYVGDDIPFTFEFPWIDGRSPMKLKQLRFISVDARGTAPFTVSAYVDFRGISALSMTFVGNEANPLDGRLSNDPQLYGFPLKFKSLKTRITGAASSALTIAGVRYLFSKGRFRR